MDLAEGDLFGMITEKHVYLGRDALIRHVFCQIIDALEHCHVRGIYHRDLKPESQCPLPHFFAASDQSDRYLMCELRWQGYAV